MRGALHAHVAFSPHPPHSRFWDKFWIFTMANGNELHTLEDNLYMMEDDLDMMEDDPKMYKIHHTFLHLTSFFLRSGGSRRLRHVFQV